MSGGHRSMHLRLDRRHEFFAVRGKGVGPLGRSCGVVFPRKRSQLSCVVLFVAVDRLGSFVPAILRVCAVVRQRCLDQLSVARFGLVSSSSNLERIACNAWSIGRWPNALRILCAGQPHVKARGAWRTGGVAVWRV